MSIIDSSVYAYISYGCIFVTNERLTENGVSIYSVIQIDVCLIYLINKNTPETRYSGVLKNTAASLFERRSSIQKREEERSRTKRKRDAFCSMPAGFPLIDR